MVNWVCEGIHMVSGYTQRGCGFQTMIDWYGGAQSKHSLHYYTISSRPDCWHEAGWVHGFTLSTLNSDHPICVPEQKSSFIRPGFFFSANVRVSLQPRISETSGSWRGFLLLQLTPIVTRIEVSEWCPHETTFTLTRSWFIFVSAPHCPNNILSIKTLELFSENCWQEKKESWIRAVVFFVMLLTQRKHRWTHNILGEGCSIVTSYFAY